MSAAWTGTSFVFASSSHTLPMVVKGVAERLTDAADPARASTAMHEVYEWPTTTVAGDELDAPFAAPTSGGPPFRVHELTPARVRLSTTDQVDPTRFLWRSTLHRGRGRDWSRD